MSLEQTLMELSESDRAMKGIATGDLDLLGASVERRTTLVQAAAVEIARLRQQAQPVPAATGETLEQSARASDFTKRFT